MKKLMSCLALACLTAACAGNEPIAPRPSSPEVNLSTNGMRHMVSIEASFGKRVHLSWQSSPQGLVCALNGNAVPQNGSADVQIVEDVFFQVICRHPEAAISEAVMDQVSISVDDRVSKKECLAPEFLEEPGSSYPIPNRKLTVREMEDYGLRRDWLRKPWRGFNQKRGVGQNCFTLDVLPVGTEVLVNQKGAPVYKADCGNRLLPLWSSGLHNLKDTSRPSEPAERGVNPSPSPSPLTPIVSGRGSSTGSESGDFLVGLVNWFFRAAFLLTALAALIALLLLLGYLLHRFWTSLFPRPVPPAPPAPAPTTPVVTPPAPAPTVPPTQGPRPVVAAPRPALAPTSAQGGGHTATRAATALAPRDEPFLEEEAPAPATGAAVVAPAPTPTPAEAQTSTGGRRFISVNLSPNGPEEFRVTSSGFSRVDVAQTVEKGEEVTRITVFSK